MSDPWLGTSPARGISGPWLDVMVRIALAGARYGCLPARSPKPIWWRMDDLTTNGPQQRSGAPMDDLTIDGTHEAHPEFPWTI